jgi:hypothetical protein
LVVRSLAVLIIVASLSTLSAADTLLCVVCPVLATFGAEIVALVSVFVLTLEASEFAILVCEILLLLRELLNKRLLLELLLKLLLLEHRWQLLELIPIDRVIVLIDYRSVVAIVAVAFVLFVGVVLAVGSFVVVGWSDLFGPKTRLLNRGCFCHRRTT